MKEYKHLTVTVEQIENLALGEEDFFIVEPMWWEIDIYKDYQRYEESCKKFSKEQRYLFAMTWLFSAVHNGGFHQFFWNATGMVWQDALKGFALISSKKLLEIADKVTKVYGKAPSFDRLERQRDLDNDEMYEALDKVDTEFYAMDLEEYNKVFYWVKENKEKFVFEGDVELP